MATTSLTCDYSITITKTGDSTRIEYNGQTYIPYHFSNRQIKEAVATARADERERIAQAIEVLAGRTTGYTHRRLVREAAQIAREGGRDARS